MSNVFAIVDFNTGAVDGFYRNFEMAERIQNHFKKRGATSVAVVEVVKGIEGNWISDDVFWNSHPVGFTGYKEPV